jgi:hypothetical protein
VTTNDGRLSITGTVPNVPYRYPDHVHAHAVRLLTEMGVTDFRDVRWRPLVTEDGLTAAEAFTGVPASCAWCDGAIAADEHRRVMTNPRMVPALQWHERCKDEFVGCLLERQA